MSNQNNISKLKELPESIKQFGGLISIIIIIFLSFFILNKMFGQGDELVAKMKAEEERIAQERKLNKLISSLPSGILVSFDGTDNFKLTDELYEAVCNATKLIPQRAIMGANFLNYRAHEIYTINGNKISETFVKWDKEKNKCFAGFVVSGKNVGVDETITVRGEALSFLSTGIDTRVYFIKNF
jgi:ribosomal protein L19